MYFRQVAWADGFWSLGTMQAIVITQAILGAVVWKRAYGKPN